MNAHATSVTHAGPDHLLTASQVARLLGVHLSTVRRWIRDEKLPAYRVGDKGVRVRTSDVARLLAPLHPPPEQGGGMAGQEVSVERRLSAEDRQRGLAILAELEQFDHEQGDEPVSDSTDLIHRMREEHTAELMRKLGE